MVKAGTVHKSIVNQLYGNCLYPSAARSEKSAKAVLPKPLFLFLLLILFISCARKTEHVFIDCGAGQGVTTNAFLKSGAYRDNKWSIYAIEANPYLVPGLARMFSHVPGYKIRNKAVWINES